ncbi:C1 family peptidase [Kitasatospora sp. NPDC003701]
MIPFQAPPAAARHRARTALLAVVSALAVTGGAPLPAAASGAAPAAERAVRAATVDWRDAGVVTPVADRGQCDRAVVGKAFATAAVLESAWVLQNGHALRVLKPQVVDQNGQDVFETVCDHPRGGEVFPVEEFREWKPVGPSGSEEALRQAVDQGPVRVRIDASRASFQLYTTGVYDEPLCSSTDLDTYATVVGYGTDAGEDYWLVKNDYGTSWGIQGYIEMSRGKDNQCGIATEADQPVLNRPAPYQNPWPTTA